MFERLKRVLPVLCALLAATPAAGVEAYCPELKWVLLAPPGGNAVQVIDVSRGVTPLATLRSPPRGPVRALHVEAARRRVWVLAENGLDVHDGFNGRLLGHWPAPAGVRLERIAAQPAGGVRVWGGARAFEPLAGVAVLVPGSVRSSTR